MYSSLFFSTSEKYSLEDLPKNFCPALAPHI